jgi:ribosomal protein S18 acetylase RimI-like enzyme
MNPLKLTVYRPRELAPPLIEGLVSLAGEEFMSKLRSRVDLGEYSRKLHTKADSIVACLNDEQAGYLAVYATNANAESAFISHVGVRKDLRGVGVATELIRVAEYLAREVQLNSLTLEVCCSNRAAVAFYEKCGFSWQDINGRMVGMKRLRYDS